MVLSFVHLALLALALCCFGRYTGSSCCFSIPPHHLPTFRFLLLPYGPTNLIILCNTVEVSAEDMNTMSVLYWLNTVSFVLVDMLSEAPSLNILALYHQLVNFEVVLQKGLPLSAPPSLAAPLLQPHTHTP